MVFFWNRRPVSKNRENELVVIIDRKVAFYFLIKKRRWDKNEKEWMYEGSVFSIHEGILKFFAQSAQSGSYGESELIKIRGLN